VHLLARRLRSNAVGGLFLFYSTKELFVLGVIHRVPMSAWHELAEFPCFLGLLHKYHDKA
jgi:hypothetical protein